MTNYIGIYDHSTGEEIIKEMTDEEQAERDAQVVAYEAELAQRQAQAEAKIEAKAALLDRLGITEDEAKLLLA
jgi:hypothetical protein